MPWCELTGLDDHRCGFLLSLWAHTLPCLSCSPLLPPPLPWEVTERRLLPDTVTYVGQSCCDTGAIRDVTGNPLIGLVCPSVRLQITGQQSQEWPAKKNPHLFKKLCQEPSIVVHTHNPSVWEAEERRSPVQGQLGYKTIPCFQNGSKTQVLCVCTELCGTFCHHSLDNFCDLILLTNLEMTASPQEDVWRFCTGVCQLCEGLERPPISVQGTLKRILHGSQWLV